MGSNSPYGKKYSRQALKPDTNRAQTMDMATFMWAFAHMICAVHTDATEKNPNLHPPTTSTDFELLPRNSFDNALVYGKRQFLSMTRLSYNVESHSLLIIHICWEDKNRSLFVMSVLAELYRTMDIHNYLIYVKCLLTISDSISKWRINTLLNTKGRGLLATVDYDRNDKERLAAIVVSLMDIIKKTPIVAAWFRKSENGDRIFLNCFECILKQLRLFDSKAELIQKQINEITELKNEYITIKKESTDFEFVQSDLDYTDIPVF
jgi:hypothetical protein